MSREPMLGYASSFELTCHGSYMERFRASLCKAIQIHVRLYEVPRDHVRLCETRRVHSKSRELGGNVLFLAYFLNFKVP